MRTVVLSDLHGEMETLDCMLEELNFDPAMEELVVLDDTLNYGTSPAGTYIALRNLAEQIEKRLVYIRGEHEQMLLDALLLTRGRITNGLLWKQNGGKETLASLQERRLPPDKTALWLRDHTRTWYEYQDFIAVHADIMGRVIWNNGPEIFLWGNRCTEGNNYTDRLTVFGHRCVGFPTYLGGSGIESCFHPNYGTWFQLSRVGAIALDIGCDEENGYFTAMIVESSMMRFGRIQVPWYIKKNRISEREEEEVNCYNKLKAHGLITQVTNEEEVSHLVNEGKTTFYIGFDLITGSLHAGCFTALCLTKRLQDADSKPIALVGGGTGMIGNPSGRVDTRSMMTVDQIDKNCESFRRQVSRFIKLGKGKARVVNNVDWPRNLNYIEFIHDIGPHSSVNNIPRAEYYKNRMEKRLSFLEFNYMFMQTLDLYEPFQRYGCNTQFDGDDQWSNMFAGTELIRRKLGEDAHMITTTLLLNSEGEKMDKTVGGVVWLDPNKTSPFVFYQHWGSVGDQDVLKCLRMLTFLSPLQIDEMDRWEGVRLNGAEGILAYELATFVYGEREAKEACEGAQALFADGSTSAHIPTVELMDEDFSEDRAGILILLMKSGLTASCSEARRSAQQGGVSLDDGSVKDIAASYDTDFSVGEDKLLKCDKKNFMKLVKA